MTATLERETVATRSSRELGRVPEIWVTGGETDLGLSRPPVRHRPLTLSVGTDEGTPIFGSAQRFVYGQPRADLTDETCLIDPIGVGDVSRRWADLDLDVVRLANRALGLQVALLRDALAQTIARFQAPAALTRPNVEAGLETRSEARNEAVSAASELQAWLGLTVDEVAKLTGVSRSAVLYWKRQDALPRPTAARNLFRVHALVRALRDAVAPERAMDVLVRVPEGSESSPFDLLVAGRYEETERMLRPMLFKRATQAVQPGRYVRWPDEESANEQRAGSLKLRPPVRRARRVALGQ